MIDLTSRYIVTGGAGFVGSNLVAALLAREQKPHVIVVDSMRSGSTANIVEACARRGMAFDGEVVVASSADVDWPKFIVDQRPSAVFHLGAITDTTVMDEPLMLRENVQGFEGMVETCVREGVPLVYASSAATYGTPAAASLREAFRETDAGQPSNVYGFSKWLMECVHHRVLRRAGGVGGVMRAPVVGLRYFNVFGPGEGRKGKMASMVYQLARQMIAGEKPRLFKDGEQSRDQVFVDDVVACTMHAALAGQGVRSGVYNLGSGKATSFNAMLAAVRRGLGVSEAERPTEYFEMPAKVREFYQDFTCADMSQTASGLGFRPAHEPTEAMERYARWLAGR